MAFPSPSEADGLARNVLRNCLHLRAKDDVLIETYPSSLPWAAGMVREARRLGGRPLVLYEDEGAFWSAVEEGRGAALGAPGDHEWSALGGADAYVFFWGPEDIARRRALPEAVQERIFAYNDKWYKAASKSGLRGARMTIARVTERNARLFGVPLARWRRQVLAASLEDPARFRRVAARLQQVLERGRTARIRHRNGTDLTLGLARRPVNVTLGEVTAEMLKTPFGSMTNVPDGTVYVAVDEETADGTFVANLPTTTAFDANVLGARLSFRDGRLRQTKFAGGGSAFLRPYRAAGAGKDRPSFLEVGLNPSVGDAPLLEETVAGAITVGVGRNAGFGGKTKSDFLGYATLAGGELAVDGRTVVRGGRVVL